MSAFKKTILVIEDNNEIRENLQEILELENFNVLTAANGKIGVEIAIKELPDLILSDILMPEMNGFGVLIALNKNISTASIPFLFLTAKSEMSDKKFGIDLGADDYITKPFEPDYLVSVIKSRIEKHEKTEAELNSEVSGYIKELENLLHLTSHKVRAPLCSCLGLIHLLENEAVFNPTKEELTKVIGDIKINISDLDAFTKELTMFIDKTRQKKVNKLSLRLLGNQ